MILVQNDNFGGLMQRGLTFILRSDLCPTSIAIGRVSFSDGTLADHVACGRSKHIIHLVLRGEREYVIGEKRFTVGENTVVYIPEGTHYLTVSRPFEGERCEGISAVFSLSGIPERAIPEDIYTVSTHNKGRLRNKMLSLCELAEKKPDYILSQKRELIDLIEDFAVHLDGEEGNSQTVFPAVEYISEHYKENDSVSVYAALCNMSESYFRKHFLASTGLSPVDYRNRLRLAEAKRLYRTGKTMHEIADEIGFCDESYLAKLYKKKCGSSLKEDAELL